MNGRRSYEERRHKQAFFWAGDFLAFVPLLIRSTAC